MMKLPEILISLLLSSLVLTLLTRHFLQTKHAYHHQQQSMDEAGELIFISNLIRSKIQMAGFTPCGNISRLITQDDSEAHRPLNGLIISPGSLQINRMSEHLAYVEQQFANNQLGVIGADTIHQGSKVLVADCYHAELRRVAQISYGSSAQHIRLQQSLTYVYYPPFYIAPWLTEKFYIRRNKEGALALFFQSVHADELTARVHSLQVNVEQYTQRSLVRLIFGLDQARNFELTAAVRSS